MPVITLTTDLGTKDHYVSSVKGAIMRELPECTIIDISHQVPAYNIQQAAYILSNAWKAFPPGTVHIIGVNAEASPETPHLAMKTKDHYFVGADNGIFSLLFDTKPELMVELNLRLDSDIFTFPTRDVFVKAACHLARGGTLEIIGRRTESYKERTVFRPAITDNSIRGTAIYIDSYSNVVYNITEKLFRETGKGRPFLIYFKSYTIDRISKRYGEVPEGEILALFNSAGYLEIAQNKGLIGRIQNVQLNEPITIEFQ